ncbi:TetR/AcrR family transcriptional regulator [Paracoccus fistulariae]|uniref:TetR/AcrR family transcriptional regulator n=1 Tax=Paracoccus fistulariae TaxID=658446 RepID=A0ABY7SQ30_9RHOB|nr:TetR/AcrR family transcriptional regulator [Paracoccus fistulariae]MDB6182285.1 TetR/AcrR family transcriptional regulator [Paracoccus fistulariae]WCR08994.1 TetR/AcrR family transcriptional regulator [Paracoccus fistulariae]
MADRDEKETGWRGSRHLWLEAARAALLEGGIDAVKIQPLATRLNLSRTSFYWFFKDRAAILDALLADWDATNTGALTQACAAYAETLPEAILNLLSVFLRDEDFDPRLDFAIRGWALQSDAVMARVAAADAQRLDAIRQMFLRFDLDPDEADVRARTVYLVQIGYISMQVQETLPVRMARIPAYVKTYTGQVPSARDLARFHARHGVNDVEGKE